MRQPPSLVLIITDSAHSRDTLSSMLEGGGSREGLVINIELVKQMDDVCTRLPRHQPDLLLLDWTGRAAPQLIPQLHQAAPDLPIVVVGDADDDALLDECLAAGAQEYLPRNHLTAFWLRHVLRRVLAHHRSQQELTAALERIHDTFFAVDREWRITYMNRAALQMAGKPAAELMGQDLWTVFPVLQGTFIETNYRKAMEEQQAVHFKARGLISGQWYEIAAYPSAEGLSIFGRDITGYVQYERQLAHQALILENVRDAAIAVDLEGRITLWNRGAEELYGWQAHEVLGRKVEEVVQMAPGLESRLSGTQAAQTLDRQVFEMVHCDRMGRPFDAEVIMAALLGEEGQLLGYVGIIQNITERKLLEHTLREREEIFRVALRNLPVSISKVDRELRYTWLYNYHPDFERYQALGRSMEEVNPPSEFAELARLKRQVLTTGQGIHQEYAITLSDGLHIYDLTLEPFFNEQGEVEGVIRAAVDITEHKRIEAALRQARDELEQRVAERTQALVETNRRLQREIAERARTDQALAEVRRHLDRSREAERLHLAQELHDGPLQELSALQYQLGELAQPLAGTEGAETLAAIRAMLNEINAQLRRLTQELRPPVLTHYGLAAAIRAHIEQMQQGQPMPPVALALHEGPLPLPEETALAFFRICQQALRNALQHAQAGQLHIRLAYEGDRVVLEVRDDGVGFVVPNQWADLTRRGHLGMAGMAERAASIGGRLEVVSAPSRGTSIRVWAPVSAEEAPADEPQGAISP